MYFNEKVNDIENSIVIKEELIGSYIKYLKSCNIWKIKLENIVCLFKGLNMKYMIRKWDWICKMFDKIGKLLYVS